MYTIEEHLTGIVAELLPNPKKRASLQEITGALSHERIPYFLVGVLSRNVERSEITDAVINR